MASPAAAAGKLGSQQWPSTSPSKPFNNTCIYAYSQVKGNWTYTQQQHNRLDREIVVEHNLDSRKLKLKSNRIELNSVLLTRRA